MERFPFLLSVVTVTRNRSPELAATLSALTQCISSLVDDYELIVIDNASDDDSVEILKTLTGENGLPNLQVFALTKEIDRDTASWVGIENALGDLVAVVDPLADDTACLGPMLAQAACGTDVVSARNEQEPESGLLYRAFRAGFSLVFNRLHRIRLREDTSQYLVISRRVVNFILRHPMPALTYRHLPVIAGFSRKTLVYRAAPKAVQPRSFSESLDRGMHLLVSTTRVPMRLVTSLSLFGAVSNVLYSVYVIAVAIVKSDVAPGWITLSLQQSGMFLLISLVLLVLGEYVLQMARLSNEGPLYHVAQEFTSAVMTRRKRLNVEEPRRGFVPVLRGAEASSVCRSDGA